MAVTNVVWYKEELDILNNLLDLKCYGLMNKIMEVKLMKNSKYANVNLVRGGHITTVLSNKLNSAEYRQIQNLDFDKNNPVHINVYYSVFTKKNDFDTQFNGSNKHNNFIMQMDKDMNLIMENDPILYDHLREKFFNNFYSVTRLYDIMDGSMDEKNIKFIKIYKQIYDYLGNWRNNDILFAIEESLKGN